MIANHSSHLDALALAAALPRPLAAKAFALAAGDTFFSTTSRAAFAAYAVNALPVWRRRTSAADIEALRSRLVDDSAIFILFPEGKRTRTGAMGPFKPGIAALVAGTQIPVVPCWLQGAHAAWPPTRRLPRPGRPHLRIGAPLTFPTPAHTKSELAHIPTVCERAVHSLAPGNTPTFPDWKDGLRDG